MFLSLITHKKFWIRLVAILFVWLGGHFVIYKYNVSIFNIINGWKEEHFALLMVWLTSFAEGHLAIVLAILFYRNRRAYFWPLLPAMLLVTFVIYTLKIYFAEPRPPAIFSAQDFFLASNFITQNSFPSGHSATAVLLTFFFLTKAKKNWQKLLLFAWAFLAGLSRVYIGVHFPIDVWHGWMIALVVMYIAWELIETKAWFVFVKNTLTESLLLNITAFVVTVLFLFFYQEKEPFIKGKLIFLFALFLLYFFIRSCLEAFLLVKRKRKLHA